MAACESTTTPSLASSKTQPEHLLIFARYPAPGKTKTRLIPALGAERAAAVSRHLTERTFDTVRRFAAERDCRVTIYFSGGSQQIMQAEFGADRRYAEQVGACLGSRLTHATRQAFDAGALRVAVIGTDCIDLAAEELTAAFDKLLAHDLVLGPALDGGYYLIGLSRPQPQLFENIDWGTERVLEQTKAVAEKLRSSLAQLRSLADIDEPHDLLMLRSPTRPHSAELFKTQLGRLSIIIPALNEAEHLPETLRAIGAVENDALEVIVVDGGSSDATLDVAQQYGCTTLVSRPGRGRQMNAGAAVATGENLLFLHADTLLPSGYQSSIEECLSAGCIAGAFRLSIAAESLGLRWVAWGANTRSRYRQFPYGDQGLFLRSHEFYRLGGYRDLALMEDFQLVDRLRRSGRVGLLDQAVCTSRRRWHKRGVLKTTLINQLCIAAYRLGCSSATIAKLYRLPD